VDARRPFPDPTRCLGDSKGIEIIGYDAQRNVLKSHYFDISGDILEYIYQVGDNTLTVPLDMPDREGKFSANISDDRTTITGRWDWTQDGSKFGYAATLTRLM
jgi:hypothetical protein